jgi:predicted AAA+ superfamily ATPase
MIYSRRINEEINRHLETDEISIIIGARQSGKTTVLLSVEEAQRKAGVQTFFLNLDDPEYLHLLNKSPKQLFSIFHIDMKQRALLFIDEIQYLENPSMFLKYFYDEYKGRIKIIASGSSAFYIDRSFTDSLVGRKKIFMLRTLSFREFLLFRDEATLAAKDMKSLSLSELDRIKPLYNEYIIFGGYPKVVLSPYREKPEILRDLAYSYIKKDILEAGVRQEETFYRLFKILASQTGGLVNVQEFSETLGVSRTALDNYIYTMRKSFHVVQINPFFTNVRKEITKMPKMYFADLGLRNFFKNDFRPLSERDDKGQLLENAVFRALWEGRDADQIRFWRTADKKEIDFVVDELNAYEVKFKRTRVNKTSYRLFHEAYPEIGFSFISLEDGREPSIRPWELEQK